MSLLNQRQSRKSRTYDDTKVPSEAEFETNSVTLGDDVNSLVSALRNVKGTLNWYDDITISNRDLVTLNTDLSSVENQIFIQAINFETSVTVPAAQNYVVLGVGEIPTSPNNVISLSVTQIGAVVDTATSFGSHNLDVQAGNDVLNPANLVLIRDATTRGVLQSGGRLIYGLFQSESSSDGSTITTIASNRVQISFVRINATGTALEAVPVADIENEVIYYSFNARVTQTNKEEQVLNNILGAFPSSSIDLSSAFANQSGNAPLTQNIVVEVDASDRSFQFQDSSSDLLASIGIDAGGDGQITFGSAATNTDTVFNGATLSSVLSSTIGLTAAGSITLDSSGSSVLVRSTDPGSNVSITTANSAGVAGNFTFTGGTGGTTGGGVSIVGGAGTSGGDGGGMTIVLGQGNGLGDGGSFSLTAGAGQGGSGGGGGNITLTSGSPGASGAGVVTISTSSAQVSEEDAILILNNAGTDGESFNIYSGSSVPTLSAPAGSLWVRDTGSGADYYINQSSGAGTTWNRLTVGDLPTRVYLQDTISSQVLPGNTLTAANLTGGVLPVKPSSGFTFNTDAKVFLNGQLLANGSDVSSGGGDTINVGVAGPTFNENDVVVIEYVANF